MKFDGVLKWRDSEGHEGTIGRFEGVDATSEESAIAAIIDEGWDNRLDSSCCVPVVMLYAVDDDEAATGQPSDATGAGRSPDSIPIGA